MNAPDHQHVARLIAAIADRTEARATRLAAALAARWSPRTATTRSPSSGSAAGARAPAQFTPPLCSCATGACLVCN